MPPRMLISQLESIGRMLNRWNAEIRLATWISAALLTLGVFAFSDMSMQFERPARLTTWLILMGLTGFAFQRMAKALAQVQTPEGVAARIEEKFPQLDNRLINFLLFSRDPGKDPFKEAYVRMGTPNWQGLNFEEMRDRRTHARAKAALAAVALLLLLPFPLAGRAWGVAMWRIINPFSDTQPVSMTHILSVAPGDASIPQGSSVGLACRVQGVKGHAVWLDVKPSDGDLATYNLGSLKGRDEEAFSNRIHQATTPFKYRFRAGDAFAPHWYAVTLRPPLAFTGMELQVLPPKYTMLRARKYDGHTNVVDVPQGSALQMKIKCNSPMVSVLAAGQEMIPLALKRAGDDFTWGGEMVITNGNRIRLTALSKHGDKLETDLGYNFLPDRAPTIDILSPKGSTSLQPGGAPLIDFKVSDDYGLGEILVQRVPSGRATAVEGNVLRTYQWTTGKAKDFTAIWKGEVRKPRETEPIILRLVARDNCPGNPRVTLSSTILFNMETLDQASKQRDELEKKIFADLGKVIELQRENLARTRMYQGILKSSTAEHWAETSGRQKEIRELTRKLLEKGSRCLGNLAATVRKLYAKEMADVIPMLERIAGAREEEKPRIVDRSLTLEEKILRQLTFAELAAAQTRVETRGAELSAMLAAMIRNQGKVLKTTGQYADQATPVGRALVDEQDMLASDVTEFALACRRESESVGGSDKNFAAFLDQIAAMCKDARIREDMLLAAERLDRNAPREALPSEQSALDKLTALQKRFDEVQAAEEQEKTAAMIEALQNANKKLEKIKEVQKKLTETMDAIAETKNKDEKKSDLMEEDFAEIMKNTKEALLEIPKDLDIFAELNVGNELVEDIFTTFEEVYQDAGSDQLGADGKVKELAVAKREYMLEGMEEAKKRLDELESWLKTSPDALKITTEAFDKEEMPAGVALVPLETEVENLIGDLLKESQALQEADQDGAINSATPDLVVDGVTTEGDVTSFAGKGESSNETPDHKEQDGRSNVGRQGMASGETSAGSGTIGKGDENIEARRTKDPSQSGQVNVDGEADTKATGGGKLGSGKADEYGQGGGTKRMDSTEAGSLEAMSALMARQADGAYAQASMKNLRLDSLKSAAHHMRQAADAIAKGAPIAQVAEFKRKALADLKKAQTELNKENAGLLDGRVSSSLLNDVVESGPDDAPPKYRDLVAEYYKKLNEAL